RAKLGAENRTAQIEENETENNQVRTESAIGGWTSIEPKRTIGFWFRNYHANIAVTNGVGPMIIDVPVIPAGAIYAQAKNPDGSQANDLLFSVIELKASPSRETQGSLSGGINSTTTKYVSGALPLGGTYLV